MKSLPSLISGTLAAVLLASCATENPATRIANNTALYNKLPSKHRQLVEQGQIARGMSPDAVYLAWGNPQRRSEGSADGVPTMRWDYAGLRPVYRTGVYGGYGYGWGRYRRGGYPYVGITPQVSYLPEQRATVLFRHHKVHSWERKQ